APVGRRRQLDARAVFRLNGVPPVEFAQPKPGGEGGVAERRVERRGGAARSARGDRPQRFAVQVVVVIVGQEGAGQGGQVLGSEGGQNGLVGPDVGRRTRALGKERIGEPIARGGLDEKGGMSDPRQGDRR